MPIGLQARLQTVLKPMLWWGEAFLSLVYPPVCVGCGEELELLPSTHLCDACVQAIASGYDACCPRCAMPLPQGAICRECHRHPHRFESAIALGKYEGFLRDLVVRAKSSNDEYLALALGRQLAESVLPQTMDAVIGVPVPLTRRLWRQVNVADLLTEAVAQRHGLVRLEGALKFRRSVKKQANLTAAQRRRNVRGAIVPTGIYDVRGARLLIVDDVLTTGATADEVARALLEAGAAAVGVAVVARGVGFD